MNSGLWHLKGIVRKGEEAETQGCGVKAHVCAKISFSSLRDCSQKAAAHADTVPRKDNRRVGAHSGELPAWGGK
jgi:hypothetical protein